MSGKQIETWFQACPQKALQGEPQTACGTRTAETSVIEPERFMHTSRQSLKAAFCGLQILRGQAFLRPVDISGAVCAEEWIADIACDRELFKPDLLVRWRKSGQID